MRAPLLGIFFGAFLHFRVKRVRLQASKADVVPLVHRLVERRVGSSLGLSSNDGLGVSLCGKLGRASVG